MYITKPKIFEQFPELIFGLSKKSTQEQNDFFNFNLSKSIGDSDEKVDANRSLFFRKIGLNNENVIIQKQIHSDIVNIVDQPLNDIEGDALITKTKNLGLAISTADCTNIYLYDPVNKIIAAVHSGWLGTEKRILEKTLKILVEKFDSLSHKIWAYFGPSISQINYEVGEEFQSKFDIKYLIPQKSKYLLDLKTANRDMLLNAGVPSKQIEVSNTCSFANGKYHSFRRDKDRSGRALGIIALRELNEY